LPSPSSQHIPYPLAFPSIGERNQEPFWRSKNIYWRSVYLPRLSTCVGQDAEAGQLGGESVRDSVRDSEIEGGYPIVAKPDQQ
jgi:hypothetical protein